MTEIREFRTGDEEQLRRLAAEFHGSQYGTPALLGDPAVEAYFAHLLQLRQAVGSALLVAEQAGMLVGFLYVSGLIIPEGREGDPAPYAFLSDLYVGAGARRSGVGRLLTAAAERHALGIGAGRLGLNVNADNAGARTFYREQGYGERFVVMAKRLVE